MALFRNTSILLKRTQSVPVALYHANVSFYYKITCDFLSFWTLKIINFPFALKVLEHYENPRNVGSLDKTDLSVGTGLVGAPACGDVMKLQIKVDENGKIVDAKFKTFGCGSAIASSSLATEWVKGKTIDEAGKLKNTDIAKELSLPPVKLHCSSKFCRFWCVDLWWVNYFDILVLAEDAIKAALADYKTKKEKASKG